MLNKAVRKFQIKLNIQFRVLELRNSRVRLEFLSVALIFGALNKARDPFLFGT